MITGSADLYVKLRQATEETRAICEAARKKLDEHEATLIAYPIAKTAIAELLRFRSL